MVAHKMTKLELLSYYKKCLTKAIYNNKICIMAQDKVTLKIPRPIYDKLKKVIEGSGFGSVNEFVVYVLRDLISEDLTKKEIDAIRQRLKNLGYL